ncbi:VG15 protein [Streptosporangium jomthongense]|uniref:Capsid maturation protease n=1 Tax=Streptosporangium jomthongense TaxID=1193683 RepID=A0ABV8FCL1_9ACTN
MTQQERAAEYQDAQRALSAQLVEEMDPLWSLVRLGAFATTVPAWIDAVIDLLRRFAGMSGALAADHYADERDAAGVRGIFQPALAEIPDGKAEASLRWAIQDLWIPEADDPPPIEDRLVAAREKAAGVAQKIVADVGRDTIVQAAGEDPEVLGWGRTTGPDACHFCALMASRGPVYHSEETAGGTADAQFEGSGKYKFHDHCDCTVYPIFQGQRWEPPAYVDEWDRLYTVSTGAERGTRAKLRAWRRAFEGRED